MAIKKSEPIKKTKQPEETKVQRALKHGEMKKRVNVMVAPNHEKAIKKDFKGISEFLEIKSEELIKSQLVAGKAIVVLLLALSTMVSCKKERNDTCVQCVKSVTKSKNTWVMNEPHGITVRDTEMVCNMSRAMLYDYENSNSKTEQTPDSLFITSLICE